MIKQTVVASSKNSNAGLMKLITQRIVFGQHNLSSRAAGRAISNRAHQSCPTEFQIQSTSIKPKSFLIYSRGSFLSQQQRQQQQTQQQKLSFSTTTPSSSSSSSSSSSFTFASESDFHRVADETLELIQDAVEDLLDEQLEEINLASGVLTLTFSPHGTWVLNKQTPNRQIWWSSPISGPRRYEYNGHLWVYTRAIHATAAAATDTTDATTTTTTTTTTKETSNSNEDDDDDDEYSLGAALTHEILQLYGLKLDLKV